MNKRSRVLYSLWPAAWALSFGGGCLDDGIRPKGTRVARLEIFAAESALMVGHTLQLRAAAWDSLGNLVTVGGLVWWSTDPALVSVDTAGLVLATAGTLGGDVDVKVSAPPSPTVGVLRLHVAVPGELKWRLGLGPMPVTGGPTEGPDGTIYVVTVVSRSQALLHAVDPKGRVKWERVASGVLDNTPIVGPDGTVYVVGQNVSAFAPDGSMRWVRVTSNFPPDFQGAAISADGVLYGAMAFELMAFRAANGDTLWSGPRATDGGWLVWPTVSASDSTVYVKNTGDSTYAFRAADGVIKWTVPDPDSGELSFGVGPVVDGGKAYVVGGLSLQELDTLGAILAQGPSYGLGVSEPAIGADGTFYVQRPQGYGLFAYRPIDVEQWRLSGFRSRWTWYGGPALAVGGVLYAATTDAFYSLQLSGTGAAVRWRWPADTTQRLIFVGAPLIGQDGTVYTFTSCASGSQTPPCSDELFAFWEDKPVEPNSPWPMWRHDARRSGQASR